MDGTQLEFFLDDGWNLIGRLHHWLSALPDSMNRSGQIDAIIRGLQSMWSAADDLEIHRIARTSLAIEQVLERIVAGSFEFSPALATNLTEGTRCLQELLLGLEATREEPEIADVDAVARLERSLSLVVWEAHDEAPGDDEQLVEEVSESSLNIITDMDQLQYSDSNMSEAHPDSQPVSVEKTLLGMLKQFVAKLDDTCQQLHLRMLTDETHYVTTTSRLEHLSQTTRELVEQILDQSRTTPNSLDDALTEIREWSYSLSEMSCVADGAQSQLEPESTEPSPYSLELNRIANEIDQLLPTVSFTQPATIVPSDFATDVQPQLNQILVVESSMFYRHLLAAAVQSSGYEPIVRESIEQCERLFDRNSRIAAIVIGQQLAITDAETIDRIRSASPLKMIGLKDPQEQVITSEPFVACVSRSRPLELIEAIQQTLCVTDHPRRQSA